MLLIEADIKGYCSKVITFVLLDLIMNLYILSMDDIILIQAQ